MKGLFIIASILLASTALAGEKRGHLEQDECSKKSVECEKRCDGLGPGERLSCKTTCRLAESECRAKKPSG